jgi:hypothetical protein
MVQLIAILVAFVGGALSRALAFRSARHRLYGFLVPVLLSTMLIHVPLFMELFHNGFLPLRWDVLIEWTVFQCFTLLGTALVTGMGWLCAHCISCVFED